MTEASHYVGSVTKLQPCGLQRFAGRRNEAAFTGLSLRPWTAAQCLKLPATAIYALTTTLHLPSSPLFHHDSKAAQCASPSLAAASEDNGHVTSVPIVTPAVVEIPEELGAKQGNETARGRKAFKIDIPKTNLDYAIETMRLARTQDLTLEEVILGASPQPTTPARPSTLLENNEKLAAKMKSALEKARRGAEMKATLYVRQRLPLMAEPTQNAFLKLVNDSDVVVVLAKTGSGKTTQVPQILLDDKIMSGQGPATNIVCTQPRRIAATSVARRVAQERHDTIRNSVGYHIRNENWSPKSRASITYCTTGILLNRLIADAQATLSAHSHIIVDEVHERDIQIDLVLSLLRNAIQARKALGQTIPKVILMSATIDPSTFLDYFIQPADDGFALTAECLDVEGRHAHVETHYLPDILLEMSQGGGISEPMHHLIQGGHLFNSKRYIEHEMQFAAKQARLVSDSSRDEATDGQPPSDSVKEDVFMEPGRPMPVGLAASVIAHLALTKSEGDILAFFPGSTDIENTEELLLSNRVRNAGFDLRNPNQFRLFKLHSLRRETNDEVFVPVPKGCRRIILATNIAETSLTLPEVVYVVDTGKARNSLFDPSTLARSLPYAWISKISSIQRRGRAGRVRHGHYYALFTKERHDSLRPMNRPAIGESDLAEVALQFKAFPQHVDVEDLLLKTVDPPSPEGVASAIKQLRSLGALNENGHITSLGRLLWRLGVPPAQGKGILLGALFGCLEPMLIIACHDPGDPLISNLELSMEQVRAVKQQYLPDYETDFAWVIEAFREYHAAYVAGDESLMRELRKTKHIRHRAYLDMMITCKEIHEVLSQIGFVPAPQPKKALFEILPPPLNAHRNSMVLVKALLINTVSAELAAWRGGEGHARRIGTWSIDSPVLKGLNSKQGVHEAKSNLQRRIKKRYRTYGRLMAYTWKREAPDGVSDKIFLEQASMVTPLMAILFCRTLALQRDQILELNDWLRLRFSVAEAVPSAIADQVATIMMELRKTIDRFVGLAWLELEKLNHPQGRKSEIPDQWPVQRRLSSELRTAMVEAVVKMLDADEAYWNEFRSRRRDEIALELERLQKEAEKAKALLEDEMQESEEDADDDEPEAEAVMDEIESEYEAKDRENPSHDERYEKATG